jgi:hypothetical protein
VLQLNTTSNNTQLNNSVCVAAHVPKYVMGVDGCTGTGTGTCHANYGDYVDPVTTANATIYATLENELAGTGGSNGVHGAGMW